MHSVSNNHNHNYTAANVGVLSAPDSIGKFVLYSDAETEKKFKQLNKDIYSKQKKVSFEDKKKTPKSVLCIFGAAALLGFWKLAKIVLKK